MMPPRFRQNSLPHGEQQEFRAAKFKILAEAFVELFELLEDYAPVWYTEQLHNRAVVAKSILVEEFRKPKTDNIPHKT